MDKISKVCKLNAFGTSVGKCDIHLRVQRDRKLYYLCTLFIRNFSSIQKVASRAFDPMQRGFKCSVHLSVNPEEVEITAEYFLFKNCGNYKRAFTILTDGGTVLFHDTMKEKISHSDWLRDSVSVKGDDFQKLKQLPNDTFVLTYRIVRGVDELISKHICSDFAISNAEYLKSLETDLKNFSAFLNEKVCLCVGPEAEIVNKAVLCAKSPVFAKMFESGMRENESNTVSITDIKMPVVRALVSFLCSGLLSDVLCCE